MEVGLTRAAVRIEAAQYPQLQSPHFNIPPGTAPCPPLPHLAIYCCNLLTSKMLLGSLGLPPSLGRALWSQVLRGASLCPMSVAFPFPHGGSLVGHWPIGKYVEGKGRNEVLGFLICLIGTGKGIMSHFTSFPERGETL